MSTDGTTFARAINSALHQAMHDDPTVISYGLGVPDPKGVFGTTLGLQEAFGEDRAFDTPTAENGLTGVAVGAALGGLKPVFTSQRLDFFLLAMDQLVNNAAKWHYMFGGKQSVPITIRLIVGRGWGQGPTHSQNLQSWFCHVPGLKVVVPVTPADAKGLLLSSIFDSNPVVFLEHRWLYNADGEVPDGDYRVPLGKARRAREGSDVTLVAFSYMTVEALHAAEALEACGITCDVIDLRTLKPMDWDAILDSVERTGRLIALDTGNETGSVAGEIVARTSMMRFDSLQKAPVRLALPDVPTPTSPALTKHYYTGADRIVMAVGDLCDADVKQAMATCQRTEPHDVPGDWFTGPF